MKVPFKVFECKTVIIIKSVLAKECGIQEAPLEPGEHSIIEFYRQVAPTGAVAIK